MIQTIMKESLNGEEEQAQRSAEETADERYLGKTSEFFRSG